MSFVVGLTGGIGSGKSTVASLFAEKGVTVIDTDQLAREVTQPGELALKKIADQFGCDILLHNHHLDRAKLRKLIFSDDEKRRWLEQLLHPLILDKVRSEISKARSPYCIVVIPLLFETKQDSILNRTLVVDATEEQQIERTHKRDQIYKKEEVKAILAAQMNRLKRLEAADDVIHNHGDLGELISQVDRLHQFYLSLIQ